VERSENWSIFRIENGGFVYACGNTKSGAFEGGKNLTSTKS
jgi:hypothetical protein